MISWLAGFLLATCGLPLLYRVLKRGHREDWLFLTWWGAGEFLAIVHAVINKDWPMLLNFSVNAVVIVIISLYQFK